MSHRPVLSVAVHSASFSFITTILLAASAVRAAPTPVVPVELRVGAFPVDAARPFTSFEYNAGSIPDVTDGSNETFIALSGLDQVNFGGVIGDTGTFYLFRYRIDPRATEFRIDVTAEAGDYPSPSAFELFGVGPGGAEVVGTFTQDRAATPTTFGITFFRDTNTGNPPFPKPHEGGLDSLLAPSGDLLVLLGGGFSSSVDNPGRMTTTLYEVSASYVVPEPGGFGVAAVLGLAALGRRRSRAG